MLRKVITTTLFVCFIIITLVACDHQTDTKQQSTDDEQQTNKVTEEVVLPDQHLQKGDQGKEVQHIQTYLTELGYPVSVNGTYDERTTWAIVDLQLQLEDDEVDVTGMYDQDTKAALDQSTTKDLNIEPGKMLKQPTGDEKIDDTKIIENPYDVLALINKEHALPAEYIPEDLVTPDVRFPFTEDLPKKQMRKVAARALEDLFKDADDAGLDLFAQSGYRSYERQEAIFAANIEKNGEKAANKYSARPGESEHQSGLTMDVTSPGVEYDLVIAFEDTPEGKWIKKHASDYGFIIRYPKGKEDITQYQYEPWHLRYVGKKAAKEIMQEDITLEEYVDHLQEE
ncbi:MAG TPA: D-alanyl-D-alanine carboxypeptidase family protein [Bacillota bacterium]|nr:D-alanyl-D-alanine carboxypeptidase family protein [Bacillota bacterium]